jgi:hypothetical protein
MQTWEYIQVKSNALKIQRFTHDGRFWDERVAMLNELGSEGWELVTVAELTYIFKRPIDPQPQVVNNTYNTYTTTMPTHPIDWHLPKVIC